MRKSQGRVKQFDQQTHCVEYKNFITLKYLINKIEEGLLIVFLDKKLKVVGSLINLKTCWRFCDHLEMVHIDKHLCYIVI